MKLGDIVERIAGRRAPGRVAAKFTDGKGQPWVVVRGISTDSESFDICRESEVRVLVAAGHDEDGDRGGAA